MYDNRGERSKKYGRVLSTLDFLPSTIFLFSLASLPSFYLIFFLFLNIGMELSSEELCKKWSKENSERTKGEGVQLMNVIRFS
jgi:uncharacterized membrane protein